MLFIFFTEFVDNFLSFPLSFYWYFTLTISEKDDSGLYFGNVYPTDELLKYGSKFWSIE